MEKSRLFYTVSGKYVNPFELKDSDIDITDIAHALAYTCRFNGHADLFYSVAQHSVLVSDFTVLELSDAELELELWGLLHDAAEAYLGDVISPFKHTVLLKDTDGSTISYAVLERRIMAVIATKYGLDPVEPFEVRRADAALTEAEGWQLQARSNRDEKWMPADRTYLGFINPVGPLEAKNMFLTRFRMLGGGRV